MSNGTTQAARYSEQVDAIIEAMDDGDHVKARGLASLLPAGTTSDRNGLEIRVGDMIRNTAAKDDWGRVVGIDGNAIFYAPKCDAKIELCEPGDAVLLLDGTKLEHDDDPSPTITMELLNVEAALAANGFIAQHYCERFATELLWIAGELAFRVEQLQFTVGRLPGFEEDLNGQRARHLAHVAALAVDEWIKSMLTRGELRKINLATAIAARESKDTGPDVYNDRAYALAWYLGQTIRDGKPNREGLIQLRNLRGRIDDLLGKGASNV